MASHVLHQVPTGGLQQQHGGPLLQVQGEEEEAAHRNNPACSFVFCTASAVYLCVAIIVNISYELILKYQITTSYHLVWSLRPLALKFTMK